MVDNNRVRYVTVGDDLVLPAAVKKTVTPAVVFGFDDGLPFVADLQSMFVAEGVAATSFVNAARVGTSGYMTWAQVEAIADTYYSSRVGFEIQDHENSHTPTSPTSRAAAAALCTSIETGIATLRSHGIIAQYYAYPGNVINWLGQSIVRRYYLGARCASGFGVGTNINTIDNLDMYRWGTGFGERTKLLKSEAIDDSIEKMLESVIDRPGIVTSTFHSATAYWDAAKFQSAIDMIQAAGVRIISFSQACQELTLLGSKSVATVT